MQATTSTPLYTPRMRRLRPGRWLVESSTRPGIGYPCTVEACSCPAGKHRRLCWHRKLVRQAEAWYTAYAAQGAIATSGPAVPPVPAPVPPTPQGVPDFHQSAGYLALSAAFE